MVMTALSPVVAADDLRRYVAREARVMGARVKSRRQSLKLTLEQVALLADSTAQTVYKVEQGEIVARDHLRLGIAFALRCEPHELFALPSRAAVLKEIRS